MYPITNEVKALFETEQPKVLRITGTDKNGTTITITDNDVIADSFQVDRYSCNGEKLEVGTAIAAQMSLTLENGGGQYNGIVFEGAELFVEVGIADWTQSSPTITYVPCGYFTPDNQPRRLSTISITGLDRMTLFDVVVDAADLTFPTTVAGLVGQVCTLCGVTLAQSISGLVNAGVNVTEMPEAQEEITYRNLIQWCAGVMGTNAWFDWNGQLRFSWYANATGYVSTADNRYSSDLYEDDLTVSGVEYTNDSGIVIVEGTDDYAIDLTGNAIVGPLVATVLPPLNTALNGFTYRPFTAATVNAPYLWPMDIVTFTDKDGNNHTSALTNVAFGLNGTTAMESKGMTYAINKLAQPKGFTREQAQLVNQAMEHVEQDIDESLTQQEIFKRLTDDGAAQGLVLYNGQLYINAGYINAGYLSAARIKGDTLTLGGDNNVNGVLRVLDANGNVITTLNNSGADIVNGSITTYSIDQQTRTILSDGILKFQFYNSAAQPIGWRDALRLTADSQSATIGTFAGIAQLDIKGRGRVYISNQDAVTDEKIAELDLDDDLARLHAYTWGEGTTNLDVQGDGLTLTIDNRVGDPFIFHLIEGQSDHPLSIGNGGTGANTAAGARTNLGITPVNIGAVAKTGDMMTGGLTFNQVQNAIAYTGTQATYDMIKFIDNTSDPYGNGISIGGGGAVIIGGGESAGVAMAQQVSGGSEVLYLCNDGDVHVLSNMQNGWASKKIFTFGADGTLTAPAFSGTLTGNVTGNCSGSSGSCTGNAATATGVKDAGDTSKTLTIRYQGSGVAATDWIPFYDANGNIVPVSSTNLADKVRDKASGTWGIDVTGYAKALATIGDQRTIATTPNTYKHNLIFQGLKNNATIGSPSTTTYSYLIGLRGWVDSSGGKSHELAFNDNGIYHRQGSTTSWENWERILTGTVGIDHGGTGATTAAGARTNLGVPEILATSSNGLQASLRFTGANGHSYGLGIFGKGQSYKIGLYDNTSNEWAWRI